MKELKYRIVIESDGEWSHHAAQVKRFGIWWNLNYHDRCACGEDHTLSSIVEHKAHRRRMAAYTRKIQEL